MVHNVVAQPHSLVQIWRQNDQGETCLVYLQYFGIEPTNQVQIPIYAPSAYSGMAPQVSNVAPQVSSGPPSTSGNVRPQSLPTVKPQSGKKRAYEAVTPTEEDVVEAAQALENMAEGEGKNIYFFFEKLSSAFFEKMTQISLNNTCWKYFV